MGGRSELPDDLADSAAEQLLATTEPERTRVLADLVARHPGHEAALRLLRADISGAEGLLDDMFPDPRSVVTRRIHGHRVIRLLGEGAFGSVYLCAQEHPVVREVAIKVLRQFVGDSRALQRFAAERQLLAALNHPAITHVFDAGALPDGRPYFVMEYVDGLPMRTYCEQNELPCDDRLQLFVLLCRGVAHAHKRGIVHRDLKPANVLVVDSDGGPEPKIIDFGIAKALFDTDRSNGPRTDVGRVIGTPGYMSPEQAAGSSDGIDERADVFALGVMLYELLTGELPWPHGVTDRDSEPVRPSLRVTRATAALAEETATGRRRRAARLRGDLDWITLKALFWDRDRRYASVTALADDIERHLRAEPVSVGPPSTRYRLGKLLRRNRIITTVLVSAVVFVGIGGAVMLSYRNHAAAEVSAARKSADDSFAGAKAVVARLLMRANDPRLRGAPEDDEDRQLLLEDALSFYNDFVGTRPSDPGLRAGRCSTLLSLSQVHLLLGQLLRARSIAAEAVADAEELLALEPGNIGYRGLLGEGLRKYGRALALAGNHSEAQQWLAAAVPHLAACAQVDPVSYGRSHAAVLSEAADTLGQQLAERRLAGMQQSLAVLQQLQRDHPEIAGLVDDRAQTCIAIATQQAQMRRFDDAEAMLQMAEADLAHLTADQNRTTTLIRRQQGRICWERGDRALAVTHMQQAVTAAEAWMVEQPQWSRPHEILLRALRDLGTCQNYIGQFAESSLAFRRAIEQAEFMVRQYPEDASRLASLGNVLRQFTRVLWDRYRREDLPEAAACAARAMTVNEQLAPNVDTDRQPQWLLQAVQAGIRESLGESVDPMWQALEPQLAQAAASCADANLEPLAVACVGLANWHFRHGRADAAATALAQVRGLLLRLQPQLDKLWVDVGWLEGQMAIARGDYEAAAAAGERILAARSTWFARRRAADCLFLAWRTAAAADAPSASCADYGRRAAVLYGQVIATLQLDVDQDPGDPWYVLPWGFATLRNAELAAADGHPGVALAMLASALPRLESVRGAAVVDQWEDAIVQEGKRLQARLVAAGDVR